jgi:hypothetical protein
VAKALEAERLPPPSDVFDAREPRTTTIFTQFIVTTAPLLVARSDLSIADVERADTLSAITETTDAVEVMTVISDEVLRHPRTIVASYRDWTRADHLDDLERAALNSWGKRITATAHHTVNLRREVRSVPGTLGEPDSVVGPDGRRCGDSGRRGK